MVCSRYSSTVDGWKVYFLKNSYTNREWDDGRNPQFLLFVNGKSDAGAGYRPWEVRPETAPKHAGGDVYTLDLQACENNCKQVSLMVTASERILLY